MLSLHVFVTVKKAAEEEYKYFFPQSSTVGPILTLGETEPSKEFDLETSEFFDQKRVVFCLREEPPQEEISSVQATSV